MKELYGEEFEEKDEIKNENIDVKIDKNEESKVILINLIIFLKL